MFQTARRPVLSTCALLCAAARLWAITPNNLATPTSAPHGPFHVSGALLVDSNNLPFLIRGTQTSPFRYHSAAYDARSANDFGPHSGTSFSAIRLRLNMNAVRIPADITEADKPGYFRELAKLVHLANQNDLLVVLAATEPRTSMPSAKLIAFWKNCANVFRENPNVLFDAFDNPDASAVPDAVTDAHSQAGWEFWKSGGQSKSGSPIFGMQDIVQTIRATGSIQPIVLMGWNDGKLFEGFDTSAFNNEANLLYEISPRYEHPRTDADRDAQFGFLASTAPVIANDWDLHLEDPKACNAIPSGTDAASKLVLDNIAYFDANKISWTVSAYERGRLLEETVNLTATNLGSGVDCQQKPAITAGMGRLVLSRMFGTEEGKLVVVNVSGGISLARGGYGIAYGRIMAGHDAHSTAPQPPYRIGDLSVKITDSRNVTRPARLSWASAGWGSLNFVVPANSATGSARLTIERADGSQDGADVFIADTAPGLFTSLNCQGPAIGVFTQSTPQGQQIASAPISSCKGSACSTRAIPVSSGTRTQVKLVANGFRNAKTFADINVTVAGRPVPVVSYGAGKDAGVDELVVSIPASLRGTGETDLICHVNGRLANVVRICIGGAKRAS